jgi:hypothetical protein
MKHFCFFSAVLLMASLAVPVSAQVIITEFMASNTHTLLDEDGDSSDWIEIQNTSTTNVNLLNWYLADKTNNLTKWAFPSTNLPPGNFMIVFASNKNRRTPGKPLHTNFKLSASGEYLALVMPDGVTIATQFAPTFPPQFPDVSYGFGLVPAANLLLTTNSTGRVLVPTDGTLGTNWTAMSFNDTAWLAATNGIGFETGQGEDLGTVSADVLGDNPAGYWRLGETSGTVATNSGWIAGSGNGQYLGGVVKGVTGPQPPAFSGFESNNLAAGFNVNGARVEVPYTPDLNPSAPFTVEAWVKPSQSGGLASCVVSSLRSPVSALNGYAFYQDYHAKGQWEFLLGNSKGFIAHLCGGTVDTNHWQYLAGVCDSSTAELYVNGSLVAFTNLSSAFAQNTSGKLDIGERNDGLAYFAGAADEVSVIARALSAAEIANRYQVATNGVGLTNVFNYTGLIKTDLRTNMSGLNSSAYLRLPFNVANTASINGLKLRVRYDDGFAAYLNGALVASANTPAALNWNSSATNRHSNAEALQFESFDLTAAIGYLQNGTNVLALQGLNLSATNSDFLLQVELEGDGYQYSTDGRYFTQPTPGAPNTPGVSTLGPIISSDGFIPALPGTNDSITVTCVVAQVFAPVTNVTLNWRVMYGAIQHTPMYDDGLHGDGAAGDGVYGAIITNHVGANWTYAAGEMVRWCITAQDSSNYTSRWPLFYEPTGTAEYDGTVVQPDYVTSKLPIFQLFIDPANQSAADSQIGSQASFYYDGEFYDNIEINLRGNTTAQYSKKSHRLNFNGEHKLRHPGPGARIGNTSLLAEYMDPSYLRQYLSFWLLSLAGVPASFDYPVRVQLNGQFYQLAFHNNVLGSELLGYLGYDQTGALYKNTGTVQTSHFSTAGFEKLLPKTNLISTADFDAMARAISESLNTGQRKTNAFDILNVPEIVNYIATARLNQEGDDTWGNMCLYRDTFGSGEWSIVPYDLNLSWGQLYYGDEPSVYGQITATNDYYKSHPFFGGSQVQQAGGSLWNRMYDIIIAVPETRQMLLCRMRTLMDLYFQLPGTPASRDLIGQQISTITNLIWDDAQLDRQQWGWPPLSSPYGWGSNLWLTNGVNDLIAQYLNPRRLHFFYTHCVINTADPIGLTWQNNAGIPTTQPTNAVIKISGFDYNPASGNQDEEYVQLSNTNSYAVDISGWQLGGGVDFTFHPGTVMPANSVLYASPNVSAFRARRLSPHGGQGLFVQGNYNGHLNAQGEAVTLTNDHAQLVSSNSYAANPSPAQQYLRITEIMYNPSPAPAINSDAQQFEYIELKNISTSTTLNLTGMCFTNGVYFNFTGSAVTSLAPGQIVLVVHNQSAFTARYGSGFSIAGQYTGSLNNGGETLSLQDAVGEKILEFAYDNTWYPITDGLGFSLVIVNEHAPWDTWGLKSSWRASGQMNGSPGTNDPLPPVLPPVRVNEALTHSGTESDWIELYNPATTNVNIGGWFLTDDFYNPMRYRIPAGTILTPGGYLVFTGASSFELGANGFKLSSYGEQVYLFSGDANTNLTGYYHGFDFGAAPNGVSFGRYLASQGTELFVLQSTNTPDTNNALPRVGPVVISEIMYHPPDINGTNNSIDEFIELHNITATNVPLYCTFTNESGYGLAAITNTWQLQNAVEYAFPTNVTLAADGRLLVTSIDPVANPEQLAAFRTLYNVPINVPIFGPWSGKLDNAGETIELLYPDKPDVTSSNVTVPYVLVEQIDYQPGAPWPAGADGLGNSLQRWSDTAFGDDPTNWFAAGVTAGRATVPDAAPTVLIVSPTNGAALHVPPGINISVSAADSDSSIASVQLLDGTNLLTQWTSAPYAFTWTNPVTGWHTLQAIATDNLGAIGVSTQVLAYIVAPVPAISFTTPTDGGVLVSGMDSLIAVDASSLGETLASVEFFVDGVSIGVNSDPFFVWTATGGSHVISAVAHDTLGRSSAPASVSIFAQAVVQNPTIADNNTVWTFLQDGSDQGTNWMYNNFNDQSWDSGQSYFGFGPYYYPTPIQYGPNPNNKYITYYFRTEFIVDSLDGVTGFSFSYLYNAGAIVYLNGQEILRDNMPVGPIDYLTYAASAVDPYDYDSIFTDSPPLVLGTNVLAVEVHLDSSTSSALLFYPFSAQLSATWYGPAITDQPASQTVTRDSTVTLSVGSLGSNPLAYQWYFSNLLFATTSSGSLTLADVQTTNTGSYYVVVTNYLGAVTSSVAILTVEPYNLYTTNVLKFDSALLSGANFIFSFTAVSNQSYTVQYQSVLGGSAWQKLRDVVAAPTNRVVWLTNSFSAAQNRFFRLVTPLIAPADSDGNGMPDWWQIQYFGHIGIDPNADPDGDGMGNLQEYLAGTSPTNAASALKFESVMLSDTNFIFSFTAVSNHSYTIQSQSVAGNGAWQKCQDIMAASSDRTLWLTNAVAAGTNQFYRIVTPLQP